jgi:hypothetical protein
LCRPGDTLHGALRRYKDAPAVSARQHYRAVLASLVDEFLDVHGPCVRRGLGPWDALCAVPSSARRSGSCPFEAVVRDVVALQGVDVVALAPGEGRAQHLEPASTAFRSPIGLAGRRVLVLDDTWVTGARARSASAALRTAGAQVTGVLVVGRSVDPESAAPWARRWWERQLCRAPDRRCGVASCGAAGELPAAS